jgi:hypothetical protein
VLSRLILFGERSLRHALTQYDTHYHTERPVGLKYEQCEKAWRFCNYSSGESSDINAYLVGLIPFERIVSMNWEGDEYDNIPHIYCHFTSKKKEPYEEIIICERRHLDQHEYYSEIAKYEQVRKLSKKKGYNAY